MNLDQIREARYRTPFEPFSLHLQDGRQVAVSESEAIAISPFNLIVLGDDDKITVFHPATVESIVYPIKIK